MTAAARQIPLCAPYMRISVTCEKCGKRESFTRVDHADRDVCDQAEREGWHWRTATAVRCKRCARGLADARKGRTPCGRSR